MGVSSLVNRASVSIYFGFMFWSHYHHLYVYHHLASFFFPCPNSLFKKKLCPCPQEVRNRLPE